MAGIVVQRLALLGHSKARVLPPAASPSTFSGRLPRVSVVVPCYNYGRFLPACVQSALDQPGVDVDVLVVDDASTDDSPDVARQLAAANPRVRVLLHEHNTGHIRTYNDGLSEIDGKYVVLLSADDVLVPGALARAANVMESNPSVGFVYGNCIEFSDALPSARTRVRSWTIWSGEDWLADHCRTGFNRIRSPEVLMRTEVLRRIGGYRADLPHSGDFEMWMHAAALADVGLLGGVDQAFYRKHTANMSITFYADALDDLKERRKAFEALFETIGSHLDRVPTLRDAANRALALEALARAQRAYLGRDDDDVLVAGYIAFAREAWEGVDQSREWHVLSRRLAAGKRRARRMPTYVARDIVRDLRGRVAWWRHHFTGI